MIPTEQGVIRSPLEGISFEDVLAVTPMWNGIQHSSEELLVRQLADHLGDGMIASTNAVGDLVQPRVEKATPSAHPDLPYIGLEHVEAHSTRLLGSAPSTQMGSTAKRFYSGDVLYSRLRPYLNKVWRADRDGLCSSEFIVMPGNEEIDSNFLRYRLNSSDFVRFANSLNAGDRPRVDFDQISSFILPNFSLAAQRAAVAEIEKQFTRLEAGVTALRRVRANLKRYRAAVLKAACEGKLCRRRPSFPEEKAACLRRAQLRSASTR